MSERMGDGWKFVPAQRERIPVADFTLMQVRQQVVDFIVGNKRGVLVVDVPTGGGKTYGLPWIIKNDVIQVLPGTRMIMLEVLRMVTQDVRVHLRDDVLEEQVGMKLGRDEGVNYRGERFTISTTGSSFAVVREGEWSIIILDEFDLDQNGDVAIMHNRLYHMLKCAEERDERLVVMLPSATPDIENARKFYHEFTFEVLTVNDRIYDPDVLEVDIGSVEAISFKDIVDRYVGVIVALCSNEGYQGKKIPVGKNVLCTVPSPAYFEDLEKKILEKADVGKMEVVKVWSRSTPEEKKQLFTGGTPNLTTIFIATDLIRRGGTPEIFAAFPSGWQVRDYCDSNSGMEGTREERSSQADYRQDEGRCSRKERGLVVRSLDSKRPASGLTFLERKPLATFLLNLIHYEDIRTFRWWGDVSEEKIAVAIAELKRFGATEEQEDGSLALTSLGRAMRGLSGSLRMRTMVFSADKLNILPQFLLIVAGMSAQGALFGNAKGRQEIKEAQKPLRHPTSDFLSVLRVWREVSKELLPHLEGTLRSADRAVEFRKEKARRAARDRQAQLQREQMSNTARRQVLESIQEDLDEHLTLIELTRKSEREDSIEELARRVLGDLAFRFGLYKKELESFLRTVLQSASFLNGRRYRVNGSPERTIELDPVDLLSMGPQLEAEEMQLEECIHKVVLGGFSDFLCENIPYRGRLGYFYKKAGTNDDAIAIFPGSTTFESKGEYLIGIPVDHKGSEYLENVVMFSKEQLAKWLPEVAPWMILVEEGLNLQYDAETDAVVSTNRASLHGVVLKEERVVRKISDSDSPVLKKQKRELLIKKQWNAFAKPEILLPSVDDERVSDVVAVRYGRDEFSGEPLFKYGGVALNMSHFRSSDFKGEWFETLEEAEAAREKVQAKLDGTKAERRKRAEYLVAREIAEPIKTRIDELYDKQYYNFDLDQDLRRRIYERYYHSLPSTSAELKQWAIETEAFIVEVEKAVVEAMQRKDVEQKKLHEVEERERQEQQRQEERRAAKEAKRRAKEEKFAETGVLADETSSGFNSFAAALASAKKKQKR
ncbi:MAG: hypothetical protein AAB691_04390 [Patescibacteria group bacterium]